MAGKLRRLILQAVAGVLYYSGVLSLRRYVRWRILRRREVCVLTFHRVLTEEEYARSNSLTPMAVKEPTFARLLAYVTRHFTVLSLAEFLKCPGGGIRPRKPWCVVTFDDGWRDNYKNAYPWLERFRVPATVFVVTGLVEKEETFWVERLIRAWKDPSRRPQIRSKLAEFLGQKQGELALEDIVEYLKHMPTLKRAGMLSGLLSNEQAGNAVGETDQLMNWSEVVQMSRGGVEFGSHTVTHPLLTYEDEATVERELGLSKQALEQKLGITVRAFAYPNGSWDDRVRKQVQRAGYACAFTTQRGWHRCGDDLLTIRRILLSERKVTGLRQRFSPAMFNLRLACWF